MADRPYFQKSIKELEALFLGGHTKRATLVSLQTELSFRNTARAKALEDQVMQVMQKGSNPEAKASEKPLQQASRRTDEDHPAIEPQHTPVQRVRLKRADLGPKPKVTNAPQDVLRAWTALEVLSPQSYKKEADLAAGDNSRIARFDERDLPWVLGERSRPKKRLFYELCVGSMALSPAIEGLLTLYADNRPDKPAMTGFCPIASVILDKEGRPLEEKNAVTISSFAWGVPIAMQGDLKRLADWPEREKQLLAAFTKRLIRRDEDEQIIPLSK